MRALALLFVGFASFLTPALARAGDGDDGGKELLRRGVQLRREHRNAAALEAFQRALAISPTPTARAQIALAEEALGRWVEAERDLGGALGALDDAWIAKNRSVLEAARAQVTEHLGWLTVAVDVADAEVRMDGRPIVAGREERVASGPAVLAVSARGYVPDIRHVEIAPSLHARFDVVLMPLVAQEAAHRAAPIPTAFASALPSVPTPMERSARAPSFPTGPAVLAAAGVASIGVGIYFGIHALDERRDRDAFCDQGGCTPPAFSHDGDARSSSLASTAAFGAGAAAIGGAAVWWILDARRSQRPPSWERPLAPFVLGGLGLVGAAAGAYFGVLAMHDKNARDAQCSGGTCDPGALSYDAEARMAADLSTVAFGAGAALLGGGATLWFLDRGRQARWPTGTLDAFRLTVGPRAVLVQGAFE